MLNRRRLLLAAAAITCLVVASGASADPVNTFTGAVTPTHVKPANAASYAITLTNDSLSPEGADRAKIGIPPGFSVGASSVQATAGAAGVCQASTWAADGELLADGKINLKRPEISPSDELCPGATLTVVFTATSGGVDGSAVWASELLRGAVTFALAGTQPTVQVDGTAPVVSITSAPDALTNQASASFTFNSDEAATFECSLDDDSFEPCSSPKSYAGLVHGSHTFDVRATDPAGNSAESSHTWTIDTASPTTTISDGPEVLGNDNSATFTFTTSEPADAECNLDSTGFASCTSPKTYTGLADGPHTFVVRATDTAGNTGAADTYAWTIDTVAPVATIQVKPGDPSNVTSPSFGFGANEPAQFQCRLDAGTFASCDSPKNYSSLGQGAHTFVVKATDTAGNTSADAAYTWTIDTTPPTTTISLGPSNPISSTSASFEFAAVGQVTFECKLDDGAYGPCSSPKSYASLGQGSHTFVVRATDLAGNVGPEASQTWTVDTVAPTTTITDAPVSPSNDSSPTFEFAASESGSELTCKLDDAAPAPCTSPKTYVPVTDGPHTFSVTATDDAGNTGAAAIHSWTVDTAGPTTSITDNPLNPSNDGAPSFAFTASETGSFSCRLDAGAFEACGSPKAYASVPAGLHTFSVRSTDAAGNTGTAATFTWTIDTTAPTTTIGQPPSDPSNNNSPTFTFTAGEPVTFACKLDGASFAPCFSPQTYELIADGPHTFAVRATDLAGNLGSEVSHSWTVDTAAPTSTITAQPDDPSNDTSPTFAFTASEAAQSQCKLNDDAFAPCEASKTYQGVADGLHTFSVRATDTAGNTGAPATYTWTIDTGTPTTTITVDPNNPSNDTSPSFTFTAPEPALFQCKLDDGAFENCVSPHTYNALSPGQHTFSVKATDLAGNAGNAVAYSWTIDTTPPTTEITVRPGNPSSVTSPSFSFTVSEAGSSLACKLDDGAFEPCVSPKTYNAVAAGSHTFSVRATDAATNIGSPETYSWTIDTTAPTTSINQRPANPSNESSPSFAFTASESGGQFECRLDTGGFAPCVSAKSYAGLADGSHTFAVRSTDPAGNLGLPESYTWVVDTVAPAAAINVKPQNPTNDSSPTFAFAAGEPTQFHCKIAAAFEPCSSPLTYPDLPDGSHTFVVKATDLAGNPGAEAQYTWIIDTVAPAAAIASQPSNPSNDTSPAFSFTAGESGSTFLCKLDAAAFASCSSPKQHAGLAQGVHTFAVKATDQAGNTGPEATYAWTIDTSAPTAEITQGPGGLSNVSSPSFSFTASQAGSSFVCKRDDEAFATCVSPKPYTGLADGPHTFVVKATDLAGNTSAETSYSWTIDTVAPSTQLIAKPNDPSNVSSPSVSFSAGESGSTFACKLDTGAFASCVSPKNLGALVQGSHTFSVRATDPAGNTGPDAVHTWTIDTAAPTTTITQKPGDLSNSRAPTFAFTASEPGSFSCRLDGEPFAACEATKLYSGLADGSHTFTVRTTDPAGNVGGPTSHTWTIDATAPTATISQKPGDPSNDSSPTFAFGANEPVTYQCTLDAQPAAACTTPKLYTNVAQGQHTFVVIATDTAGNVGQATFNWRIDTTPPTATITHKPLNPSKTTSSAFAFTSNESGVVFACRIEGGGYEPCDSPRSYTLTNGPHDFAVRATDPAGNIGAAETYTWTIDTVAPTTAITAKPAHPSNNRSPSFSFTGSEDATFVCRLDGTGAACTSPAGYSGLADGPHVFSVEATDAAGNTGPQASHSWTIETRAPTAALTSGPSGLTNTSAASFVFSADEPASFDCKVDDRGYEPCTSPATYHGLVDGAHTFLVRAWDAVGNVSTQVAHSWTIDTTAPETTLVSAPKSGTASSATFAFSASEGGRFACRLDGGAFALCGSPKSYSGLSRATHQFEVRAIDAAGNADATPAVHGWTIQAPVVKAVKSALLAPRAGARVTRPPVLSWRRASRARYYNVQIYRGRRKVLTAWPTRTRLQLKAQWKNLGRKERLTRGSYRWYVWPGYGAPSARRYGQLLGQSTFVVARRSGR